MERINRMNCESNISVGDSLAALITKAEPREFVSVVKILKSKYGISYTKQADVMQISAATIYECLSKGSHEGIMKDLKIKNCYFRMLCFYCLI